MKVQVLMLAFGKPGEIREVTIPNDPDVGGLHVGECFSSRVSAEHFLEQVYHFGQNDFQNLHHPSVSVGDVAIMKVMDEYGDINDVPYLCCSTSWRRMTVVELALYCQLPARTRAMTIFTLDCTEPDDTVLALQAEHARLT